MAKQKELKSEPLEKQLWKAADKLRKNIDAAEYKHVVLGLIFLKYISDSFEAVFDKLHAGEGVYSGADPEDKDEYKAENTFYVPPEARWSFLLANARQPDIGQVVDGAMDAIERENAELKGVLPKVFARQNLDPTSLGGLIDLIGNIALGDAKSRSADVLGHVFEYFLGEFALAEGKKGGQFYTPRCVVELLVAMLEPYKGRVFDPCCGSGGMFVQSEKFVEEHQGRVNDISIYGQESNQTTWRLAKMNLAIRGIDASQVKWNNEGSFLSDAHKDLKADFIIANPPFNDSNWGGELLRNDGRWAFGIPPEGNANYAWIQHFLFHLAPKGIAGIVMHGGAASNKGNRESDIRRRLIESNVIDCVVALPTQLFYNTTLPVHLWILNRNRTKDQTSILMIDAYEKGEMVESTHRVLSLEDIMEISDCYRSWKNVKGYSDTIGFCKEVAASEIMGRSGILAPNRYVTKPKKHRNIAYADQIAREVDSLSAAISVITHSEIVEKITSCNFKENHLIKTMATTSHDESWISTEVKEVVKEVIGGSWGNEHPKQNNIAVKVIRGTDLPNIPLFNLHKTPTRYLSQAKVREIELKPLDIVIEMSGGSKDQPTGRAALITEELLTYFGEPVICSNFCKVIRIDTEKVDPYWFYFYWQNRYKSGLTTRYENQPSGIKNFQLDEFIESEVILLPPAGVIEQNNAHLTKLFNLRNKLNYSAALLQFLLDEGFENSYEEYEE